jgi:hypothetical protein
MMTKHPHVSPEDVRCTLARVRPGRVIPEAAERLKAEEPELFALLISAAGAVDEMLEAGDLPEERRSEVLERVMRPGLRMHAAWKSGQERRWTREFLGRRGQMATGDGMVTNGVVQHACDAVAGSIRAVRSNREMARKEPALFALARHEAAVVVRALNEAEVEPGLDRKVRVVLSLVAARVYEALRAGQDALWGGVPTLDDPVAVDLGPATPDPDDEEGDDIEESGSNP